jgi:nucleoid-associated protein YgaU
MRPTGTHPALILAVRQCTTTLAQEVDVGLFDRKNKAKPDFSNVRTGSSTNSPEIRTDVNEANSGSYTVRKGDTLSAIAQREYGDANEWRRIYEANRDQIQDPDLIHPGQELDIPNRGGTR